MHKGIGPNDPHHMQACVLTTHKRSESTMPDDEPIFDFTRREAMATGGMFLGASIVARRSRADAGSFSLQEVEEAEIEEQGLQFFTLEQAEIVQDMANRIYPSDENGPGAPEAGVVYFIDRQMNQDWGQGERWYTEPPFAGIDPPEPFEGDPEEPEEDDVEVEWAEEDPADTQGWQYALTPAEAYTHAITAVEEYCETEYGSSFVDLEGEQQDAVIQALEDDAVDTFEGIDPSGFFTLLRANTLEGMFSDPMYGGNQDMIGWRLKNFPGTPGALGSYRQVIDEGEYIAVDEPRSIADDVQSVGLNPDGDHEH